MASARMNPRSGGFLGIELKFFETKLTGLTMARTIDASGGMVDPILGDSLNAIDEGTGQSERDGRKALLKSIVVEGMIAADTNDLSAVAHRQAYFFIALVLDTQTNGAQMTSEGAFKNVGSNTDLSASPMPNLEFQSRFKIIKQLRLRAPVNYAVPDGAATGSVSGYQLPWRMAASFNIPVNYTAIDGGISTIMDNSLHLIAWTSSGEQTPKISYSCRVRFLG